MGCTPKYLNRSSEALAFICVRTDIVDLTQPVSLGRLRIKYLFAVATTDVPAPTVVHLRIGTLSVIQGKIVQAYSKYGRALILGIFGMR